NRPIRIATAEITTTNQAVLRGLRAIPKYSSTQVSSTNATVASHTLRSQGGNRRNGCVNRVANNVSAPNGHIAHQRRPTNRNAKMMAAHQMVQVSFVAKFCPPTCVSVNP